MEQVKSKKIVGIDLGTTNSVISVLEGANTNVITNAEGGRTTPSVVAYTQDGTTLVGQLAKRQAVVNPENTFSSVKRFIGCKFNEIEGEVDRCAYKIKSDNNGNIKIHSPIVEKDFSPEEISASVLKIIGVKVNLIIGVSNIDSFKSHAWIEVNGTPILENTSLNSFKIIYKA